MTDKSKTEVTQKVLDEQQHLAPLSTNADGRKRLWAFMEEVIWPQIPAELLGKKLSKAEEEEILGFEDGLS